MYASIAFQQKIGDQDFLTYKIPAQLENQIKLGQLVELHLRKTKKTGLITEIHDRKPEFRTVEISSIINETPLLTEEQIRLATWIRDYYFAPFYKVLKLFIPSKTFKNNKIRKSAADKKPQIIPPPKKVNTLTVEQQKILTTILEQNFSTKTDPTTTSKNKFLIHGITGSGKTEIYLHLAKEFLKRNKQVLILVPEIALTPQTVEYFESGLQMKVAVIHSKLSEGEKRKTWLDIFNRTKNVVIGSRSSIFSPFKDLGIIIIDEEHENSYKQDQSPRYLTHTVAEKIQELNPSITLVLGSATPSIETAVKYKDTTFVIKDRIGSAKLPIVQIVDMREEFKKGNKTIFSDLLQDKINKTLKDGKQAILFLNRRGSASSIVCRDCGYKLTCTDCDIPMTYHARTLTLPSVICHHCGKIGKIPINCPTCGGLNIRFLGIGTERIEEETKKLFTKARVLRADKDTTSRKTSFEQIYSSFKKHEADILIGTQMIGKGLHIPNVNLVGVILADIGLNMPDFKSSERTFQLLTQVAGRAGRSGDNPGEVVIQTYNPDHYALQAAETHDYTSFFKVESEQRNILRYPPFTHLAQLTVINKNFQTAKSEAQEIEKLLKKQLPSLQNNKIEEISCYPAFIARLHGKYRFRILIKGENPSEIIRKILPSIPESTLENLRIDIDPISTS